jgi:hypothetical protein
MVGEETPEGNASPSGLEASGRSNLPWAQVKILQSLPKIKPPEVPEVGGTRSEFAVRASEFVC